ncbi:carboxymuconolactone decarboxylase family protein [Nocardia sp. CA-129566]|uniref:carboxymuconolactone decarboxylase family protein n=1 Tax=Nocardia sp. CA-129566 TaxID=3239976 RepID=UPI003D97FA97
MRKERIGLPAGEDPFAYIMLKIGSPRLNKSLLESWDAQYFNDSTVTPRERECLRTRLAQQQQACNYCDAFRLHRDAQGFAAIIGVNRGEFSFDETPEELYERVFEYATWPGYTERERLAIEFGERFCHDYQDLAADDAFWERMKASFSDTEIADLCLMVGVWDSSAKMFHLLVGFEEGCPIPDRDAAAGSTRETAPS